MSGKDLITFILNEEEIKELKKDHKGQGGFQDFLDVFDEASKTIKLNDEKLGKIIRYIGNYGKGGFQSSYKKIFLRSIKSLLGV